MNAATYTPIFNQTEFFDCIAAGNFEEITNKFKPLYHYERIGIDRFIAIKNDLEQQGMVAPSSLLDIGCNIGFFSQLFSILGYKVTGIDNELACKIQPHYPASIQELVKQQTTQLPKANLNFVWKDVIKFMQAPPARYEICLLLSVVHQWYQGYADSNQGQLPVEEIFHFSKT